MIKSSSGTKYSQREFEPKAAKLQLSARLRPSETIKRKRRNLFEQTASDEDTQALCTESAVAEIV